MKCAYCENPDKSKWVNDCQYVGNWPSRADFISSTFDAPCSLDAYDEGQREISRHNWKMFALLTSIWLLPVITIIITWRK